MADQYTDRLIDPSSTEVTAATSRVFNARGRRVSTSPQWSAALDKKYDTKLMAEEGIEQTNGASILNNMAGQYASSVRQNAPRVRRNANAKNEYMKGLLGGAQGNTFVEQPEETEGRAQLRQTRQRNKPSRHSYKDR